MSGRAPVPLDRQRIVGDLAEVLFADVAELTDDTDLLDLGLDSIRMATVVDRWRADGARVRFSDLAEITTVGAWVAVLTADAPQ
ncbi:hypothetical protein GCM10009624_03030 [Gordonia sinesedis]